MEKALKMRFLNAFLEQCLKEVRAVIAANLCNKCREMALAKNKQYCMKPWLVFYRWF